MNGRLGIRQKFGCWTESDGDETNHGIGMLMMLDNTHKVC